MSKSLNALMKHLRASGIDINGSAQKRKLKNMGYYHGYKGYRFVGKRANRLPLTEFSQVIALHDFDMELKSLFYPRIMQLETALKSYTLDTVLRNSKGETFEAIYAECLTCHREKTKSSDIKKAWDNRLRLKAEVDSIMLRHHDNKDVIRHFKDADREVPVWAIFEMMTLGNFGQFYLCLSSQLKTEIAHDLGMPASVDSAKALGGIIFALKDLRNAVAHNAVVMDVRFKTASINKIVGQLLSNELGIKPIDFLSITDYFLLITYLMTCIGCTKTERNRFVTAYETIIEKYRGILPANIFARIIGTQTKPKIHSARQYIKKR